jgi:poly(hydroxyalkanoate) depolymerase family esterase
MDDWDMITDFSAVMRRALELTRAQNVMEATRTIRRALSGPGVVERRGNEPVESPQLIAPPPGPSGAADPLETAPQGGRTKNPPPRETAADLRPSGRLRRPLGEVLNLLRQRAGRPGLRPGSPMAPTLRKAPSVPTPDGAAYLARTFAGEAGSRDYKVYVPSSARGRALPLIVMLHGCAQNPDDFVLGTGMNRLAEERGFIVAYPGQPVSANPSACWNWFSLAHQARDQGEPSIIAGVTRAVMAEFPVEPARVFVAGLSAGGAMAAVMSATYPELYAAAGIHSGLPYGVAADVPSALAAMRRVADGAVSATGNSRARAPQARVRTIVFHGREDKTVNPSNAEAIFADLRAGLADSALEIRDGVAGGRAYRRTVVTDARGVPCAERWAIEGLGHAWSGGSQEGSFTDAGGPDASREMLRFFLDAPPRPGA